MWERCYQRGKAGSSNMYSFTLSLHLPGGLPLLLGPSLSLIYTFFTNFSFPSLLICPNHLNAFLFTLVYEDKMRKTLLSSNTKVKGHIFSRVLTKNNHLTLLWTSVICKTRVSPSVSTLTASIPEPGCSRCLEMACSRGTPLARVSYWTS